MNKENCALKLVDEIILYYDARSIKHQITRLGLVFKIAQFKIHPPLYILLNPSWLTAKYHYPLIGPTFKF